jgi:hypothetical protein
MLKAWHGAGRIWREGVYAFDAFNMFNHPDFDAPNNNVVFFPNFTALPTIPPQAAWE